MSEEVIRIENVDRVRVVTIDRPQALNSMNNAVFGGIRDALAGAEADNDVAVAMITGEGRAFSAGQDLQEMQDGVAAGDGRDSLFPTMLKQLTEFEKPLIAAVNGLGVGIGMTFLAHCDLVLMSSSARLRTPFPQLGLAPEAGSSYTFATRMGWQNAAYVLMSGRWFSADECLQMGLVWKVTEPDELISETMTVAQELAANPIPSLVATKKLLMGAGRPQEAWAAHKRENAAYAELLGAPANTEALAAFLDKREPDFSSIPGI
ncbi:MAG: enoyl-CoA hydratase-related protein [Acidimicrobiales bacterium]|nr:enoyl-CoA hydratase-related protein [Acidimicrobiales bacterium]